MLEPSTFAGLALFLAGLALRLWGIAHLRGAGLPPPCFERVLSPRYYVQDGPYAYLRHPLYVGALAMLVGLGFMALGWPGIVIAAPAVPFYRRSIVEENALRELYEQTTKLQRRRDDEIRSRRKPDLAFDLAQNHSRAESPTCTRIPDPAA